LVFDLAEGRITRLLVIEDLASFVGDRDSLTDASTSSGSGSSTLGELAPYGEQHEPVLHRGSLVPW
jgi:hypothetical protein